MNPHRQGALLLCLGAVAWSTVDANDPTRAAAQDPSADTTIATPLRKSTKTSTTNAIAGPNGVAAWVDPARCDQDGNLFFLTVPQVDARDSNRAPGSSQSRPRPPSEIVGVSADGKKVTHFDPGSAPVFVGADELRTVTTAVDSHGILFALVWGPRGQASGRQHIVSFDKSGRYVSRVEIESDEISVEQFEIFGTGEFLLRGVRNDASKVAVVSGGRFVPRLAVMSGGGAPLRDVLGLPDEAGPESSKDPDPSAPPEFDYMIRGGDGRIYLARAGASFIYAIEASGQSQEAFPMARTPRNLRLAGLRASGGRLVATCRDERSRWWMVVYDVALRERVGLYGPVDGQPICYEYTGSTDEFTFLRDGNKLVTLSP